MPPPLRVMCWNIAEGNTPGGENSALPGIAEQIRAKNPDLVLLNEVRNWDLLVGGWLGNYVRQAQQLAELAGLRYCRWGNTVRMGWTGHKAVAILSKYSLTVPRLHPIMRGNSTTGYAILETTFEAANVTHHVFSTRFDAHNEADNISAHQQALTLIQSLAPNVSVIFGGDFNANVAEDPHFTEFVQNCGLVNAYDERPDSTPCIDDTQKIIDHIFYRGPYRVTQMELRCPWAGSQQELSDHPWVFVELSSPPDRVPPASPGGLQLR